MSKINEEVQALALAIVASQQQFGDVEDSVIPQVLKAIIGFEKTIKAYKEHVYKELEDGAEIEGIYLKQGARTAKINDLLGVRNKLKADFPEMTSTQLTAICSISKTGLDGLVKELKPIGTPKIELDAYVHEIVKAFGSYSQAKPSLKLA